MISNLTPLLALFAPLLLWPVEYFLPFPAIIEELVKATLVYFTKSVSKSLLVGLSFSLSETILYLPNLISQADVSLLVARLLITTTLHTSTCLIMAYTAFKLKKSLFLGLLISIILHQIYNSLLIAAF
jgi:hypothetical protein